MFVLNGRDFWSFCINLEHAAAPNSIKMHIKGIQEMTFIHHTELTCLSTCGVHLSAITVSTPEKLNHTKGKNKTNCKLTKACRC